MGYDIYGNNLRNGHCEVHPNVHEEYPCSVCISEWEKSAAEKRTQEPQYCDGNPAHCENSHYLGQAQEHIKDLESRVKELILQLAGKESVIKELCADIAYYRKDRRDQMIQDQGLPTGDA